MSSAHGMKNLTDALNRQAFPPTSRNSATAPARSDGLAHGRVDSVDTRPRRGGIAGRERTIPQAVNLISEPHRPLGDTLKQ
jgi:hypothetical protein